LKQQRPRPSSPITTLQTALIVTIEHPARVIDQERGSSIPTYSSCLTSTTVRQLEVLHVPHSPQRSHSPCINTSKPAGPAMLCSCDASFSFPMKPPAAQAEETGAPQHKNNPCCPCQPDNINCRKPTCKAFTPRSTLKNPSSPQYVPQLLRTCKHNNRSSRRFRSSLHDHEQSHSTMIGPTQQWAIGGYNKQHLALPHLDTCVVLHVLAMTQYCNTTQGCGGTR